MVKEGILFEDFLSSALVAIFLNKGDHLCHIGRRYYGEHSM